MTTFVAPAGLPLWTSRSLFSSNVPSRVRRLEGWKVRKLEGWKVRKLEELWSVRAFEPSKVIDLIQTKPTKWVLFELITFQRSNLRTFQLKLSGGCAQRTDFVAQGTHSPIALVFEVLLLFAHLPYGNGVATGCACCFRFCRLFGLGARRLIVSAWGRSLA